MKKKHFETNLRTLTNRVQLKYFRKVNDGEERSRMGVKQKAEANLAPVDCSIHRKIAGKSNNEL